MSEQPPAQPNPLTAIRVQQGEIERLNIVITGVDKQRLWLQAMLDDTKAEALAEIAIRDSRILALEEQLKEASNSVLDFVPEDGPAEG